MKTDLSYEDAQSIAYSEFPFAADQEGGSTLAAELFGQRGLRSVPPSYGRYDYDETARWVYWCKARFRTAADAILFKLSR